MLVLAGCTTAPQAGPVETTTEVTPALETEATHEPPPRPLPEPVVNLRAAPEEAPPQAEPTLITPEPVRDGRLTIHIESNPTGAMILVDGRPVGRAPVDLAVETNGSGFFRTPVTIRARFVAGETGGESFSVDERLGQLERVPQALVFSHDGAQRILRQF